MAEPPPASIIYSVGTSSSNCMHALKADNIYDTGCIISQNSRKLEER
jgi:hypothetical protein